MGDEKDGLVDAVITWFKTQWIERVPEEINVALVSGAGDGALQGASFYGDGEWWILVRRELEKRELVRSLLHELAHVLVDGEELKAHNLTGDDVTRMLQFVALSIRGRNRVSDVTKRCLDRRCDDHGYRHKERLANGIRDALLASLGRI